MAARPVDAEKYMELLKEQYLHHEAMGNKQVAKAWQGAMQLLYDMPTITMPNEPLTLDSRLTSKMVTCPKGWKGVRGTRFYCPGCKKVVKKGEAYCHKCGQALIFPVQRYDKENNRIWLDFSNRRPPEGESDETE